MNVKCHVCNHKFVVEEKNYALVENTNLGVITYGYLYNPQPKSVQCPACHSHKVYQEEVINGKKT